MDSAGNPVLYATTPAEILEQASLTGGALSSLTQLSAAGWTLDNTELEDGQPTAASGNQSEQTRSQGASSTIRSGRPPGAGRPSKPRSATPATSPLSR